ncbi:MAG: alpha-N-acetylglucosaminidase C-terminal domain-containing protein, partial [Oscillospiraceae bacterium]
NLRGDEIFDAGDNFADTPWMYCTVNNFGGTRNISGNVKKSIEDPFKITDSNYDTTIMGVGLMMESITIDEIFYDIINTISFCGAKPEIGDYISDFVKNRYGKNHPACCEAFNIMAHDIYMRGGINSPKESALCARPGFKVENVSTWGGKSMTYDKKALIKVLELLLSEYDCLNDNSCYRLDLCDAARQCVANNSWTWYEKMMEAYENEEVEIFENAAQIFLRHFDIQEDILKTNPNTLLGNWISKAESYGRSFSDKRMFRYNAMALITHWGDKQAAYELHDYAHKEWSGLLTDFYKTRWESFITLLSLNIHRHDEFPQIDWYEFEQVFATSAKDYPTSPTGNLKVAAENALKFLSKLD